MPCPGFGSDWWVNHVAVSLCLFTGTRATFVSKLVDSEKKQSHGEKKGSYYSKLPARNSVRLPSGGGRIALKTPLKG